MRGRKWRDWRMRTEREAWLNGLEQEKNLPYLLEEGKRAKLFMTRKWEKPTKETGWHGSYRSPVFSLWCCGKQIKCSILRTNVYRTFEQIEGMTDYEFEQFKRMEGLNYAGKA